MTRLGRPALPSNCTISDQAGQFACRSDCEHDECKRQRKVLQPLAAFEAGLCSAWGLLFRRGVVHGRPDGPALARTGPAPSLLTSPLPAWLSMCIYRIVSGDPSFLLARCRLLTGTSRLAIQPSRYAAELRWVVSLCYTPI